MDFQVQFQRFALDQLINFIHLQVIVLSNKKQTAHKQPRQR